VGVLASGSSRTTRYPLAPAGKKAAATDFADHQARLKLGMSGSNERIPARTAAEVMALRAALWRNGYRPVPIYTKEKRPRGDNWRVEALQDPPVWAKRWPEDIALGTGLATGALAGIDVDVLTQAVVDQIVRVVEQLVAPTPLVRIGLAPKIMLAFRSDKPFRKLSTGTFLMPDGSEAQVEILADGQQFVADGIHPKTGQPYHWPAACPRTLPLEDVPRITLSQARAVIVMAREVLFANGAVEKNEQRRHRKRDGAGKAARAPSDGFFRNVNEAALCNLGSWVRALFPNVKYQPATGAWRVASKERGRPDLQEDISFHPEGIQDFGQEQGLTPIDAVMHYGGACDAATAALWLCGQLGMEPASLGWYANPRLNNPADDAGSLANLHSDAERARPTTEGCRNREPVRAQQQAAPDSSNTGAEAALPSRTNLRVVKGDYVQIATDIETIAIEAKLPIYSHGEALCRPVTEQRKRYDGQLVTVAVLRNYNAASLRRVLDRTIGFSKFDARRRTFVACEPPADIINMVLAGEHKQVFLPIRGIIGTSVLRPDRTIIVSPGYDEHTGYFLVDPPTMLPIPIVPTREDAERALELLDDLVSEFPFVDNLSRAVAHSGLITPLVRAACDVVPGHLFTAPKQGSGKSLLVDLASAIATGERANAILAHQQPEERDKQLTGALLEARQIIALDNLTGEIESAVLAQATERERISLRPLGTSQTVAVSNGFNTYLTGNNVIVAGDNTRRILVGRVDPQVENPLDRTFKKPNPVTRVFADRGTYVRACLIIVMAYISQGRPNPLPPTPSYGAWSELVREPLVWLGLPDPIDSMRAAFEEDPNNASLATLIAAWPTDRTDWTSNELIDAAMEVGPGGEPLYPGLVEALKPIARDRRGFLDVTTLGNYLRLNRDKIVAGRRISRRPFIAHGGATRWFLA
jgi:hypothetical protein